MNPGIRLANIGNMPDVQVSPAPRNAFRDAPQSVPQSALKKTKGWRAVEIALVLAAAGIFVWLGPQGLESKRQLKEKLLQALQERVPQRAVENVCFTEFLVHGVLGQM
ncbi:MAG: flagellar basal body-associated FliL family protein [Terriglobales bacterium]